MKKSCLVMIFLLFCLSRGVLASSPTMSVEINIPECTLRVYVGEQILYQAPVGIGRPGHESPVGEFTIINKIVSPTWYPKDKEPVPPGPTNPLGNYWLGLSIRGYGIHGNISPWSIGTPVSSGCIRMHNDDIEFMYRLINIGTRVRIRYQTMILLGEGHNLQVRLLPDVYGYGTTNIFKFLELVDDLEKREEIFIPEMISLFEREQMGVFSIPWKIGVQYKGNRLTGIGYEQGGQIYIDPLAVGDLVRQEEDLAGFLLQSHSQYVSIAEVEKRLLYHRVVKECCAILIEEI